MKYKELLAKYDNPDNFISRDLSWVEFNKRVLEEALNADLPLLEKIKFVSIFSSNLDEFYMIRVSGIKEQISVNISEPSIDGLTPAEQLQKLEKALKPMIKELVALWKNQIVPQLLENGVQIYDSIDLLSDEEKDTLNIYFKKEIYPILTPLAFDPGRPFPYISNLSLSLAVVVRSPNGEEHFARVKVPNILPRLVQIDKIIPKTKNQSWGENGGTTKFVWLGDLIRANLQQLFPKMEVVEAHRFRITRDTDIELQEDEADDLLLSIEENIRQRRFGNVVRLEVEKSMPTYILQTLIENLEITMNDIHIIDGPLGLSDVMMLYDLPLHNLKEKPYHPVTPKIFEEDEDIFTTLKKKDILLHHPFHSFNPVVEFIKKAAADPEVMAIKQTLYRVGSKSPIIRALIEAAERGKQVAVLVELKARFDEENNIFWARELEKVGAHVVYGLVGLKTHAKMTLVVRRESNRIKKYVHLATGNYNATTAKVYTDFGFFTTDEEICSDVTDIFNYLTGYSKQTEFNKLIVAPINLRSKLLEFIFREIENIKLGKEARIIIKTNSLTDPLLIAALYEASNAGVTIDLLVRGVCCLVPGVKKLSENIKVKSVVGRYLEHSRIFYFYNDGLEDVYLSSADWMQRNLDRRVEIAFPIENPELKNYIINSTLKTYLKDNVKTRVLKSDGMYECLKPNGKEKAFNSQSWFMTHTQKNGTKYLKK